MAITLSASITSTISIDEYIDHVNRYVDVRDFDSIAASGFQLARLASDKELVPRALNDVIRGFLTQTQRLAYTPQSFILGRTRDCYIRANIWPNTDISGPKRKREAELYSYLMAHNHSFDFVTCGYFGPGYTTRILEVDPSSIHGEIGEEVEMKFLEETMLPVGKVMAYRAHKDVHTQFPPQRLSISINLMCINRGDTNAEQYFFDTRYNRIVGYPKEGLVSRRAKLVELASSVGNDQTFDLLMDIANTDNNARVRREAIKGIVLNRCELVDELRKRIKKTA